MAAETETRPRRSALASARVWRALDLAPELRKGVEAAARAAGVEPETWLSRTIMNAAAARPIAVLEIAKAATADSDRSGEAVEALTALASAARGGARQPEEEPPESHPIPIPPEPRAEPADLPVLSARPPQRRRQLLGVLRLLRAAAAVAAAGVSSPRTADPSTAPRPNATASSAGSGGAARRGSARARSTSRRACVAAA